MSQKKKKELTDKEKKLIALKYEIAQELGLSEDISRRGWGGLTSRETGKIGGHMTKRLRGKGKNNTK